MLPLRLSRSVGPPKSFSWNAVVARRPILSLRTFGCYSPRFIGATKSYSRLGLGPFAHARYASTSSSSSSGGSSNSKSSSSSAWSDNVPLLAVGVLCFSLGFVISRTGPNFNSGLSSSPEPVSLPSKYATSQEIAKAIQVLKILFPGNAAVTTDEEELRTYGFSENSYHPSAPHSVIVRVHSTEDVSKVMKVATKYRVPVTAYGGGTSLEGHFAGYPSGSICIDFSNMNKILNINVEDGDLTCQAGAGWEDINAHLKEKGLPYFFPLDPGPGATIGGMVGTGCSGTNAVRYGTAKGEWFLNLTVVLPDGEIIKTRRRARKSSAGFDTTKLFIGAEGTLGIITEATLRLAPLLPTKVAFSQFPNVEKAVSAVQEILATPYGQHIQCVELVDDHAMATINASGTVTKEYPVSDSLFFKIQGDKDAIAATAKLVKQITKKHGSTHFEFAATEQDAENLWEGRKYCLMSYVGAYPACKVWTTDVCVPVSKLPQLIYQFKQDIAREGLQAGIVGHVGDGNFHSLMLFKDDEELEKVKAAVHRLVEHALALDGTCTGEHGVGIGKKEFLIEELGQGTVNVMKKVKNILDPQNICNPGKLYPDENDKQSR